VTRSHRHILAGVVGIQDHIQIQIASTPDKSWKIKYVALTDFTDLQISILWSAGAGLDLLHWHGSHSFPLYSIRTVLEQLDQDLAEMDDNATKDYEEQKT
jgi:hypothetical protein